MCTFTSNKNKAIMETKHTQGEILAMSFVPFIKHPPNPSDLDGVVRDMANAIDVTIDKRVEEVSVRVKQLLTALDYSALTEYQKSVINCVQEAIKEATS